MQMYGRLELGYSCVPLNLQHQIELKSQLNVPVSLPQWKYNPLPTA
jgi:hypothetical protein